MYLIFFFTFIFGTIIGSFLNVVVLRYGTRTQSRHLSAVAGRSFCFSCGKTLSWFELIPVLSFFVQKGRCRGCKSGISWQYPLVECITGAVFVAVVWKNLQSTTSNLQLFSSFWLLVVGCQLSVFALLIAIAVYDIRHKIIPNALVYGSGLLSLFFLLSTFHFSLSTFNSLSFWSGPLLALPFVGIWFFSRGRAMGLGDAKLILFFPWLLGLAGGLSAVLLGFWIGASVSVAGILLKGVVSSSGQLCSGLKAKLKNLTMKTELPLAPFLILGLFIVYLWGIDVTGLSLLLQGN